MTPATPADLVVTGGTVHTVTGPPVRALAVRGDRVVALGTEDDARALVGPGTRLVDLDGRCVVPGFVDAHVHDVSVTATLVGGRQVGGGDSSA